MSKVLISTIIVGILFSNHFLPDGWTFIEKETIRKNRVDVYFFDYMTRLGKLKPEFKNASGRDASDMMTEVEFQFPTYIVEMSVKKNDSVYYFLLLPNPNKIQSPNWYDLVKIGYTEKVPLSTFEDSTKYKANVLSITDAVGCRGSLVYEHSYIIQASPDGKKAIGNGIQIVEGIFTRVVPYSEVKTALFRHIETTL